MSGSSSEGEVLPAVVFPVDVKTAVPGTGDQLFKTVLVEGTGSKPLDGSKVSVHYVGTLASDGSKFDSSRDRGEQFEFTIGKGQVIKGWDKGVATMRIGEKCVLECAPDYAYGAAGSPPKIPANSTLHFEVELFGWTKSEDISEAKDRSLMKMTRKEGDAWDHATFEAEVTADVATTEYTDDVEAADVVLAAKTGWSFVVGDVDLPVGLEEALKSMRQGETAVIDVAPSRVTSADAEWKIVSGRRVRYVVTLTAAHEIKPYSFEAAAKVEEALKRKDQGNGYFKEQKWAKAAAKYRRALEFIEFESALDDDAKTKASQIKIAVYNNLAQVELNQQNPTAAKEQCRKCLDLDPANVKALFRRGKAEHVLGNWDEAQSDLKAVLEVDGNNVDAQRELAAVQERIRAHRAKEKAAYGNMFAKLASME